MRFVSRSSFLPPLRFLLFFSFNAPPTTEIYTLSLHDALPICLRPAGAQLGQRQVRAQTPAAEPQRRASGDRKSTRLNSSHQIISYAVFCLKKKKKKKNNYNLSKKRQYEIEQIKHKEGQRQKRTHTQSRHT